LMSCFNATFTLTPLSPIYSANNNWAFLYCYGDDVWPGAFVDLPSAYANNTFFFSAAFAADPSLVYTQWVNLKGTRYLLSIINLQSYAAANPNKQLALIFGFDVMYPELGGTGQPCARLHQRRPSPRGGPDARLWRQSVSPFNRLLRSNDL